MRVAPRAALLVGTLACSAACAAAGAAFTWQHESVLSPPDCVDASHIIAELAASPLNGTYLRVQHIGDPGTAELGEEIAKVVHWDVGALSGFPVATLAYDYAQRGFRDQGPPEPASAFQLWCNGGGFYIDTARFTHFAPIELAGPNVSIARDLHPPAQVFRNGTSALTLRADVAIPVARTATAPVMDGTAQVSFFYYARDVTTGTVFAHVIELFDNREPGVGGAGRESVAADAYNAFASSPLLDTDGMGRPMQFVTRSAVSESMHFATPWIGRRRFAAHVTYSQFATMLDALARSWHATMSVRPQDYRVTLFGVLGEVFPGTTTAHEVALGASATDLALSETYDDVTPVQVVEFHNATLDHYFVSAQPGEIDALDSGRMTGWQRTGASFAAYPVYREGASPVCRFYLPPGDGDSHFFSASPDECAAVRARFPTFVLESPAVMHELLPDAATGACPSGSTPVYRFWNGRADSNHRYVGAPALRAQMIARGYIAEGYGPDGVAMCAPTADALR